MTEATHCLLSQAKVPRPVGPSTCWAVSNRKNTQLICIFVPSSFQQSTINVHTPSGSIAGNSTPVPKTEGRGAACKARLPLDTTHDCILSTEIATDQTASHSERPPQPMGGQVGQLFICSLSLLDTVGRPLLLTMIRVATLPAFSNGEVGLQANQHTCA